MRAGAQVRFASSESMDDVASGTVHAVVCSPPYWDLKDYGHPEQIGHGESYEEYHRRMDRVWAECLRALAPGGTMWIVIDKVWHEGLIVHIPFDIAQRCERLGFDLVDLVVWNKPTAIAGMNERNLVNKYEIVVALAKPGAPPRVHADRAGGLRAPDATPDGKQMTDLWRIPVKAGSIRKTPDHKAPYPDELIRRIVALATDEGETVLDPFLGSGTTMKVALEMGRRCIGYEINRGFEPMIASRLRGDASLMNERRRPARMPAKAKPKASGSSSFLDERIRELGDWRGETLARIRALILEADPEMIEERKWIKPTNPWGVPVWSHDGMVCTGEVYKSAVKITFARGASLPDPARLFNASLEGQTRRAIDIHAGQKVDARAFKALVKAAVALNGARAKKA